MDMGAVCPWSCSTREGAWVFIGTLSCPLRTGDANGDLTSGPQAQRRISSIGVRGPGPIPTFSEQVGWQCCRRQSALEKP